MHQFATLTQHPLATQPLRDLLSMAERPETPAEKRITASLVRAYQRMGKVFPSEQFGDDLDAVYTEALSVTNRTVSALSELLWQYGWLTIETENPSLDRMSFQSKETISEVFEASYELHPDLAGILKRCDDLLFMALDKAATRINAALEAAEK